MQILYLHIGPISLRLSKEHAPVVPKVAHTYIDNKVVLYILDKEEIF